MKTRTGGAVPIMNQYDTCQLVQNGIPCLLGLILFLVIFLVVILYTDTVHNFLLCIFIIPVLILHCFSLRMYCNGVLK